MIDRTTIQGQSLLTSLQVPERGRYTISLIGLNGAVLQQHSPDLEAGAQVISLPLNGLAHGTYVVKLSNNRVVRSKKFVW